MIGKKLKRGSSLKVKVSALSFNLFDCAGVSPRIQSSGFQRLDLSPKSVGAKVLLVFQKKQSVKTHFVFLAGQKQVERDPL